jgi:outer membrane immunogenic protein
MKKILLTTTALLLSVGVASAADLEARPYTKAPAPMMAPVTNWTGFYIGGFGGYGWSDNTRIGFPGFPAFNFNGDLDGGFGGGTIGYNWQTPGSAFVEVDAAAADIGRSETLGVTTYRDKIDAFGSVTGRVGAAIDTVLIYTKGGYAWANNEVSATDPFFGHFSQSKTHSGWTVGAGLEWMFAHNWSGKVEYQYYNMDSERYLAGSALVPTGVDLSGSFNTIKVGVNYHFN